MKQIESIPDMAAQAAAWRAEGRRIGLVPTMGGLHAGKEALIRAAAAANDVAVVSIFVNPLQFGPNENAARYPRRLAEDLEVCSAAGAAAAFVPSEAAMLPAGYSTYVAEESLARTLCGPSRPTHFRGVTTATAKLLNIVRPDTAYFGQKTAQRAAIVRKMCSDLSFPVEISVVPTVREADGLAVGNGNAVFSPSQRQDAVALSRALDKAKAMVASGVRHPDRLIAEATHILGQYRRVRVIYVSLADVRTLEPAREVVPGRTMLAIAAWIDEVRLIDNAILV
jgi:pantoate--beta-alanine ligase